MDRHLNIFEHYHHDGTLPIENNISRGLAILFQEYPLLLDRFIDNLNSQSKKYIIDKPIDSFIVDFQIEAANFVNSEEPYNKIVGVALTARELGEADISSTTDNKRRYITDISIRYNDTLIIIEVKRSEEDCKQQLSEQIVKYKNAVTQLKTDKLVIDSQQLCLTWEKMIDILLCCQKLIPIKERIMSDYIEHINRHYPSWFPEVSLSELSFNEEDERIFKRLNSIKNKCINNKYSNDALLYTAGRNAISLNCGWASECNFQIRNIENIGNCFVVGIWPADIKKQWWVLWEKSTFHFATERLSTFSVNYLDKSYVITMRVMPYIKLSHFRKGVVWQFFSFNSKSKGEYEKFKNLLGRWEKKIG